MNLNFNEYQNTSKRTMKNLDFDSEIVNYALGLAGESGETVDYLKKIVFHGHVLNKEILEKELGDVLWYISALATVCDISLEQIAIKNIEKLKVRYPDGFSEKNSIARKTS